jgi:hypothetical protein
MLLLLLLLRKLGVQEEKHTWRRRRTDFSSDGDGSLKDDIDDGEGATYHGGC